MRNHFILLLLGTVLLTGCPSQPVKDGTDDQQAQTTGTEDDAVQTGRLDDGTVVDGTALAQQDDPYRKDAIDDAASPLSQRLIYFEFDDSSVKQEFHDLLTWHGRYLASNPDMKLRLEGHTDERGTREYNIALGERRSQSVRRLLMFQGAADAQLEVISYGEEKPAAYEHDENAWSQNRRVELVYEVK